jgi:hypothetical protein
MNHMYSADMARAVEVGRVHGLDTAMIDFVRLRAHFLPPQGEAEQHGLPHETRGMH